MPKIGGVIPSSKLKLFRSAVVSLFIKNPLSVSASSKEAFWFAATVPIPTLKRLDSWSPPNAIVLIWFTVTLYPIATA